MKIKKDPIKEFNQHKSANIKRMANDKNLKSLSLRLYENFSKYNYQFNFNWLGQPFIQVPQDIVMLQEIIWQIKPDLIIELGIAHGGGLLFHASMLEIIGKGTVLGIDIDIRKHNRAIIEKHKMFKRIKMIEGSSIDKKIVDQVSKIAKKNKKIMVCLDSLHTHQHVLTELNLYSKFVSVGSYLIVFDTIIEYMPSKFSANRPWDVGNNPKTAVDKFLRKNKNFIVDKEINNKLLITCAPGGYLKRIK